MAASNAQNSDANTAINELIKKYDGLLAERDLNIKLLTQKVESLTQTVKYSRREMSLIEYSSMRKKRSLKGPKRASSK